MPRAFEPRLAPWIPRKQPFDTFEELCEWVYVSKNNRHGTMMRQVLHGSEGELVLDMDDRALELASLAQNAVLHPDIDTPAHQRACVLASVRIALKKRAGAGARYLKDPWVPGSGAF